MKRHWQAILGISIIALLLSSCSVMTKNQQESTAQLKKTEGIYQQMQLHKPDSLLQYSHQVHLTGKAFRMQRKSNLPTVFSQNITYTTAADESIKDTLDNIGRMTNLAISFDSSDLKAVVTTHNQSLSMVNGKLVAKSTKANNAPITNFHGPLEKVLNQITNSVGLFWRYKDGGIQIFSVETKVYNLDAPIGKFSLNNKIASSSDVSGSGAESNQSAQTGSSSVGVNYDIQAESPWNAATKTIKNMLSSHGRLDSNPVEGYITVSDTPDNQKAIAQYIEKINDKTNKKIAIRVDVYDVEATSGSNYGMDINGIVGAFGSTVQWTSDTTKLLDSNIKDSLNKLVFKRKNGDRSVVFNALSQLGKTTEVTGTTVYTISGQPAPVQNSIQQGYLKSVSSSVTSNGDASSNPTVTATLEPGTITTGYSMTVTPRIESTNEILVSLNLQLSNLVKLETFSSNPTVGDTSDSTTQQIQLPTVHSKNFLENMILKNGETLLIAGFQDNKVDGSTSSLADPALWPAGGTNVTDKTKTTTVVVITPYIVR